MVIGRVGKVFRAFVVCCLLLWRLQTDCTDQLLDLKCFPFCLSLCPSRFTETRELSWRIVRPKPPRQNNCLQACQTALEPLKVIIKFQTYSSIFLPKKHHDKKHWIFSPNPLTSHQATTCCAAAGGRSSILPARKRRGSLSSHLAEFGKWRVWWFFDVVCLLLKGASKMLLYIMFVWYPNWYKSCL